MFSFRDVPRSRVARSYGNIIFNFFLRFYLFIHDRERDRQREREAETQAEGEAGSMHREPDVGHDPRSPGSRPGPKAGAKPLRHPGIPIIAIFYYRYSYDSSFTEPFVDLHLGL